MLSYLCWTTVQTRARSFGKVLGDEGDMTSISMRGNTQSEKSGPFLGVAKSSALFQSDCC